MTGALLRTGSIHIQRLNFTGSLKPTFLEGRNGTVFSPTISLRRSTDAVHGIRRSLSDTNMTRLGSSRTSSIGSASFPSLIVESEEETESSYLPGVGDVGFPSDGFGNGRRYGGHGGAGGGSGDRREIGEYYQQMLKANPGDSLLLRNYGKYLHEVEKDVVRAEEYYGRAILASPGDGELLSLYGKLIWETQRERERAKSYFDQAVHAAPEDCTVLGSYAHFLWEADEEEEEIQTEVASTGFAMDCAY